MFKNNEEDEADFCEAYKSQILNVDPDEEPSSFGSLIKIITILILLVILIAVSIYSYNYFINNGQNNDVSLPPQSVQMIDDDELKVTLEEEEIVIDDTSKELDIDEIANDVKVAISKNEQDESKKTTDKEIKKDTEPLKVPIADAQSAYIEELAKLTDELDKERE